MSKFESSQDWEKIVWTKKPDLKLLPKTSILNNKQKNVNITKNTVEKIIDNSNEPDNIKPVIIDINFSKLIRDHRMVKKISQVELAKQLSIPVAIIKDYENGTGIQNGTYVSKIKKFLNIHK